jgi:hypothetical protein
MSPDETFHAFDLTSRNRLNGPETVTMASLTADKSRSSRKPVCKDTMEYRLIFAVCFPVFLVTTLAERLSARALPNAAPAPAKSFLGEAIEATHRCTSLAFMG